MEDVLPVVGKREEESSPRPKRLKLTAASVHSGKPSTALPVDALHRVSRRKSKPPPLIFVGLPSTSRTSVRLRKQLQPKPTQPLGTIDLTTISDAADSASASSGASPPAWKFSACTESLQSYFKPALGLNVDYYSQFFGRADADTIYQQLDRELQPFFQ